MASVQAALDLITSSSLSPTEHLILKHFVEAAVDPDTAANYLISQTSKDNLEDSFREFKRQWRILATRSKAFRYPFVPSSMSANLFSDGLRPNSLRNPRFSPQEGRPWFYNAAEALSCTAFKCRACVYYTPVHDSGSQFSRTSEKPRLFRLFCLSAL